MNSFISFSAENIAIMRRTRELLDEYNGTGYDENDRRSELQLISRAEPVEIGDDVWIYRAMLRRW